MVEISRLWIGPALAVAFGGLTVVFGAVLLTSSAFPTSEIAGKVPLSVSAEKNATRILSTQPYDLETAKRWNDIAISQSPSAASPWLRYAYIERIRSGSPTPAALIGVHNSYRASPFGPDVTLWRVPFLLEQWPDLPLEERRYTISEIRTMTRWQPWKLQRPLHFVSNPNGHLAGQMARQLGLGDRGASENEALKITP